MKTVCVYHSIDLDGFMSAAIVKHWFITKSIKNLLNIDLTNPNTIDFIGYNYGEPIPDLSKYDKVIMCDISFPKEEMLKLNLRLGENFIWIDHHQRTINEVNKYIIDNGIPMEGLVTEEGELKAACELTWKYFFPNEPMPEIVRLLGRYDCFGHKGTNEEQDVLIFQYAARAYIKNYEDAYGFLVGAKVFHDSNDEVNTIEMMMLYGSSIYQYLCTEAKQTYKNGFKIEFREDTIINSEQGIGTQPIIFNPSKIGKIVHKFICINKERFNPINFGIDYHKDGYDGCACFHYANGAWNFSLYNDNGLVDCSIIAKQFGGGGHAGASGMRLNNTQFLQLING